MPVKGGECGCDKKGGAKKGAKKASKKGAKKPTPYNIFMGTEIKRLKTLAQYKNVKHIDIFKKAAENWSSKNK